MNKLVILVLLAAPALAVPMPNDAQLDRDLDCFEQENALFSCVFAKTISSLDRAARSSDIEIFDGVKFVRETPSEFNILVHLRLRVFSNSTYHFCFQWNAVGRI